MNIKQEIQRFILKSGESIDDYNVHSFAEKLGIDKEEVEEYFYSLAYKFVNLCYKGFPGDKGYGYTEDDVDKKELEVGILVEQEHTSIKPLAKRIAISHLVETPNYYSKLIKCGIVDEGDAITKYKQLFNK